MRIFYYAQVDLSGQSGSIGSVRHVLEIVNRLSGMGHSIVLFVPEPEGDVEAKVNVEKVLTFPSDPGYFGFLKSIIWCTILILMESLKKSPDCIYAREMLYTSHTPVIAKILSCKHVTEVNGFQPEEVRTDPSYNQLNYPVLVLAEAFNYWLSDRLITVSATTDRKVRNFYRLHDSKTCVIRNGVNTDRCRPMDKVKCRKNLGFEEQFLYAGFLGYLFPWSGVDYIIKAAPIVLEEIPEAKFIIIGSGTWGKALPELARKKDVRDSFIFTGEVPWSQVPEYLNCLDIGLSPYTRDRDTISSLKTYEYLACGLPVILSNLDDVREIITGHNCGLLVEPESPEKLAEAIVKLFSNSELRSKLGENGRNVARNQYDWSVTAERTEKLVRNMIQGQ